MKRLTIIVLTFLCTLGAFAQEYSTTNKKAIAAYEAGLQNYKLLYYDKAESSLLHAIKIDQTFFEAYYLLAGVYSQQKDTAQMLATLKTCVETCGEKEPWAYYELAYEQYELGLFNEAQENLNGLAGATLTKTQERKADDLRNKIKTAKALTDHPISFKPVNVGSNVNTQYDDYHPSITVDDNTLIYTINVPTANPKVKQEDLFVSQKTGDSWGKSKPLSAINTVANEGAQSITADGKTMFFTICNAPGGLGSCDIYITKRFGDQWSKPKNIGAPVNSKYWDSQPATSADGRTLYFASNRPGGQGQKDIWMSQQGENGSWSEPVNLGASINTKYDDESPFIHADGITLYFASDGHDGIGGKDLYGTTRIGDGTSASWSDPINLGSPINTHEDESHLIINAKGDKGYFASNRYGGSGGFDIYEFSINETFKVKPNCVTYVTGTIFDAVSKEKLSARVTLHDLKSGALVFDSQTDRTTGGCIIPFIQDREYALSVEKQGYVFYSETISLTALNGTSSFNIPLQQISVGNFIVLKNIYFQTNSSICKDESRPELATIGRFMRQNPTVHIEIAGHTDNIGNATYNKKLSEERAAYVAQELIKSYGVDANRITHKGYGDTKPSVPNTSDENRAKNRRTELRITQK